MKKVQTRALVEGAVFAAITVLIGIFLFYVPIVAVISIFWSVPTILIAFRHGLKVSINSVVVSAVLVSVLTQPVEGLSFFIGFGLPGIIMGYLLQKKVAPGKTVFLTGIVLALCSVGSIYLGMLVVGTDIIQAYNQIFVDMKAAYREAAGSMAAAYGMMGVSPEDIQKGTAAFEKSMDAVKLVIPGGILVSGIFLAFVNFKLTRLVLKRINHTLEDVIPFSVWKLSGKWMLLVLAALLFSVLSINVWKIPQLHAFSMNLYTVVVLLFSVLGLSVAKFFLDKYAIPKAVKGIILLLVLLVLGNVILFVGIFDQLFDFRKLRSEPAGNV